MHHYNACLISTGGTEKHTNLANNLLPVPGDSKCIIYVDFIRDVAPLAISLLQNGIHSCAYRGDKMSTHDKQMALESWRNGQVEVSPM